MQLINAKRRIGNWTAGTESFILIASKLQFLSR